MDLYAHLLLVLLVSIFACVSLDFAIFKLDAVANLLDVMCSDVLVEIYVINLLLEELRMSELRSHVSIVGEKQYTCGVAVETTYRVDALAACILHEIHNSLALLWVVACCHIVLRFVEKYIYLLLDAYWLVVELHLVGAQHLGSEFGNHLTINGDHSCLYVFVSLSTAAYTCICKILVEADRLIGIVVFLLVLDTLLHAVLGIWVIAWSVRTESSALLSIATTTALLVATALLSISTALLLSISATTALLVATALLITTALSLRIESSILLLTVATALLSISSALLLSISATTALLVATALLLSISTALLTVAAALLRLRIISSLVIISWTIRRALLCTSLQSRSESFGTESAFVLVSSVIR